MDYKRFIELAARYFEKVGTTLHMRTEHYSDTEGSPDCILIDEIRNTYYLVNIGLPPDIPKLGSFLQGAVNEYSEKNDVDIYTVSLVAALGECLNSSKLRPVDDPMVDTSRLKQKGALIIAESAANGLTDYLQKSGIEFKSIPLRDIFTIYLFEISACEEIVRFFEEIGSANKAQGEKAESFPSLETPAILLEDPDYISVETAPSLEASDQLIPEPYTKYSIEKNEALMHSTLSDEVDYPSFQSDDQREVFSTNTKENDGFSLQQTTFSKAKLSVKKKNSAKVSSPYEGQNELLKNTESFFYTVLKNIWSLIIYFPAYILLKISRGKVPSSLVYWISGICALFGVYYFPLGKWTAFITVAIKSAALTDLRVLVTKLAGLDPVAVFASTTTPENLSGFIQSLINGAVTLMAFDISLLSFMISRYYLQYAIALGFLFTIFPVCRTFGKRIVCFLVTAYFLYIPVLLVGMGGIKLLVLNNVGSMAGVFEISALTILCSVAVGTFLIALLIPFAVCFFAAKVCGKDIDLL